ncbi:hypothetical protein L211DRAFT_789760, partial [Terfezia boudieri ATCC MYA-4762]
DLDFIMPNYACNISLIPKTMIFVDSWPAVSALTDHLICKLIAAWSCSAAEGVRDTPPEDVIYDYSTILSGERRQEVLAKFHKGSCRVMICINAAGMGIDIRDISRVI